jgi:hypothetical protein
LVLGTMAIGLVAAHPTKASAQVPTPQQAVCQFFARTQMAPHPWVVRAFGCPPQS